MTSNRCVLKYTGPMKIDYSQLSGKGVRVAIVDSGICLRRFAFEKACVIRGAHFEPVTTEAVGDSLGHGTACAGIIKKIAPASQLFVAKICHDDLDTCVRSLIEAISWCTDNSVNVINVSLGTSAATTELPQLEAVCRTAYERGITIVSANTNSRNALSVPAKFPFVIGVDAAQVKCMLDYYYRPNGHPIEILAKGDKEYVQWVHPDKAMMAGTSFAAPKVTAMAACIVELFPTIAPDELKAILRANSMLHPPNPYYENDQPAIKVSRKRRTPVGCQGICGATNASSIVPDIKNAVIFPFNKEMHSLIRFRHTLPYSIVGVVDFVGKRTIGKDPAQVINMSSPSGLVITGGLEQALALGDTLLLGHLDELERLTNRKIFEKCVEKAATMGKLIYSLRPLDNEVHKDLLRSLQQLGVRFYSPVVDLPAFNDIIEKYRPQGHSKKPVLGVFGTSSQQGKFTLQLIIKEQLSKLGYKVGHLSTEHQGELLGADVVFPVGYAAEHNLFIPLEYHVPFYQSAINKIESLNVDITVAGGQGALLPASATTFYLLNTMPTIATLIGLLPDAVILVVNYHDQIEYIRRTIVTIESMCMTKVIALALSPIHKVIKSTVLGKRTQSSILDESLHNENARSLEVAFNIPILSFNAVNIGHVIEKYLS